MNRGFRNRNVLSVELNRDGLNAPWGLRLKGGKDVDGGTPLEITRVSQRRIFSNVKQIAIDAIGE